MPPRPAGSHTHGSRRPRSPRARGRRASRWPTERAKRHAWRSRMARLTDEEIEQRLTGMDGWERDGDAIRKTFEGEDFMSSVKLVNALAPLAEEMNHHPDLEISWNKVTVSLSTHSEGGLTESDFELAGKIDALGGG